MGKYDLGYEVFRGSTVEWALQTIRPNSVVLEFGPFNGKLTKHLKEDLFCSVDIVELDQEAGESASRFARDALVGRPEGDIETYGWVLRFAGRKYDYIVFLDVIEHLVHTEEVLNAVRPFMKDTGVILLSIPNVAYNGVLLNLMRNRFSYTELGILDNTHLRFFSYESICELGEKLGYAVKMGALQAPVAFSETKARYDMVPKHVEHFLKSREFGNAYQYLVELSRADQGEKEYPRLVLQNIDNQIMISIYVQEAGDTYFEEEKRVCAYCQIEETFQVKFDLTAFGSIQKLRIDPTEYPCLLSGVSIRLFRRDKTAVPISLKDFNGVYFLDGMMLFPDADPQIILDIPMGKYRSITFSCRPILYDCPEVGLLYDLKCSHDEDLGRVEYSLREKIGEEQAVQEELRKLLMQEKVVRAEKEKALAQEQTIHAETEAMLSREQAIRMEREAALAQEQRIRSEVEAALSREQAIRMEKEEALAQEQWIRGETEALLVQEQRIRAEAEAVLAKERAVRMESARMLTEESAARREAEMTLAKVQEAYDAISNAFFWKITKPLRVILDALKSLLRMSSTFKK